MDQKSEDESCQINDDQYENEYFNKEKPIKRKGCFKKLTFGWINPLINFSRSNQFLQEENVKNIHLESSIEFYIDQLKAEWKVYQNMDQQLAGKHALFKSVLRAFWGYYRNLIFLNILTTFLKLLGPMLVKKLIDFIKRGEISWKLSWDPITGLSFTTEYGLFLVLLLVISSGITFIVEEHITFSQEITSNFICNAVVGLIYEKTLRLSPASNKKFKSGDLITFIQVDVNKLNFLCFQFPGIFQVPIYFLCGFYLLYQYLGYSFLAGLAVFAFGFLCNLIVTRKNAQFQKLYMNYQKDRVSLISECLSNIKTLKIFSWIEIFEEEIKLKRQKELNIQYYKFQLGMLAISFVILFPQLMSTIAIAVYVYFGNNLEISTAYTINIVFNLVKVPLRMLPQFISQLTEFLLAMNRIQEFLLCCEINPSISCILENQVESNDISLRQKEVSFKDIKVDKNVAIEFRFNGYYHWGVHLLEQIQNKPNIQLQKNSNNQNNYINQWSQIQIPKKSAGNEISKEGFHEKSKFLMEIENSSFSEESYESILSQQNQLTSKKSDKEFSLNSTEIYQKYRQFGTYRSRIESTVKKQKSFNASQCLASPSIRGESFDKSINQFQIRKNNLSNLVTLKELNFKINKGELVCILGDVGSGKSSIISAIIGDLLYLENDFYKLFKNMDYDGYLNERIKLMSQKQYNNQNCPIVFSKNVYSSDKTYYQNYKGGVIAYAPQDPIIQNKSLRENILFGQPFDYDKYWNVIEKCQLKKDIEVFPGGDMQELGERGVNLSGGQKIRISLARAVYANRDIILMDDPISALDRGVLKSIFEDLLLKELKHKTRIMATHSVEYLHLFDKIILLQQGKIVEIGTYEQVKYSHIIQKLKKINRQNKNTENAMSNSKENDFNRKSSLMLDQKKSNEFLRFSPECKFIDQNNEKKADDVQQIFLEVIDEQNQILDADQMNMDSSLSQCKIINVYVKKQQQYSDSKQNSINQKKIQIKNIQKLSLTQDQKFERGNHQEIISLRNKRAATQVQSSNTQLFNLKRKQTLKSKYTFMSDENKWKITTKDDEKKMKVTFQTYKRYSSQYFGGWKFIILSNLAIILFTICKLYNDYLLGVWAQIPSQDQHSEFQFYTVSIIGSSFLLSFIVYIRAGTLLMQSWYATKKLHEDMVRSVLNAPINLYFDKTPLSRIMNIFSKDLNQLEIQMTYHISTFTGTLYQLIGIAILAVQAHYSMIILIPFAFVMCINLLEKSIPALVDSANFLRITKNPILSNMIETMNGSSTIRVYGRANEFLKYNIELLDKNLKAVQIQSGVNSWFSLRIDFISVMLIGVISTACVFLRPDISENEQHDISKFGFAQNIQVIEPILLSMLLSYVLNIQTFLVMLLKYYVQIETNMINAERCMNLCDIIQEVSVKEDQKNQIFTCQKDIDQLLRNWPQHGEVEFKNVSIQYRPNSQIALDRISFKINSQEKIGIVGRTGAGKSTIGLSLTRIVEVLEGKIIIDGIDIAQIPLKELRKRITLIPQDPVLFTGSLRFNLDPQNQFSDDELIDVLNKANLSKILKNNEKGLNLQISENGQNFSSGERQLICVCRAVLRKSKLIVLDEATAFIDIITERLIQKLVQNEFQYSTMITIAHRLNTIMKCNKVMVLSFGKVVEFDSPQKLMQDPNSQFKNFLNQLEKNNQISKNETE